MKDKAWGYITAIVVLLILLNPEMWTLALFIDAIGLEIFILLLHVQILAIFSTFFRIAINPIFNLLKQLHSNINSTLLWTSEHWLLVFPSQATIMHLLVLSAGAGVVLNTF